MSVCTINMLYLLGLQNNFTQFEKNNQFFFTKNYQKDQLSNVKDVGDVAG